MASRKYSVLGGQGSIQIGEALKEHTPRHEPGATRASSAPSAAADNEALTPDLAESRALDRAPPTPRVRRSVTERRKMAACSD